ncbi:serine/threonine-protein kinase Chk2 isoform X8 [Phycodurus eques]|uniref:serine/threonine-protein kinase Chk2 isoform X8 n=1 Tax=Phycodurus eques TaxID=693459 RepID=UPI002ACE9861|nr:serine/threonine-protein kinase Chk2 isoform X8 [Phycodurus eques]
MSQEIPNEGDRPRSQSPSQARSTLSPSRPRSKSQSGSGSSGGPPSGSQSSGGSGTLSSVDTLPVTLPSVPEEPECRPWGRLLPMQNGFRAHDCVEDEYLFGRDSKCNYVLDDPDHKGSLRFRIYSKKHFRIYREGNEAFIQDLSNNGTFVDGDKIGRNKKLPLVNNAVLALSEQRNKAVPHQDAGLLPDGRHLLHRVGVDGGRRALPAPEISTATRRGHGQTLLLPNAESGAVPAQPGHHPPRPETGEHPSVLAGRRLSRQGDGLQPVADPGGGGPDEDAVRDAGLPGARSVDARHRRRLRPARGRLEPRGAPLRLPVWVPAVPRELRGAVGQRADRPRPVHHGAVQVAPRLRPGQGHGEEASGGGARQEDEHRRRAPARLDAGPCDVGEGSRADVSTWRCRACCHGGGAYVVVEETAARRPG